MERPVSRSEEISVACSSRSVRAATQSSTAAMKSGPEKECQSRSMTAEVRSPPGGMDRCPRRNSAIHSSARCLTAWATISAFVGKWWSCAPRETPARSATSLVVAPA